MAAKMSNASTFAAALANGINSAGSAIAKLSATDVKTTDPSITTKISYSVKVKAGQSTASIVEVTGNTTTMTTLANSAKVPGTKDITTVAASSEVQTSTPLVIAPVATDTGFLAYLGTPTAAVVVRVRVQIIRHFKACTTDIYLHNDCAHVGSSVHAPVLCISYV